MTNIQHSGSTWSRLMEQIGSGSDSAVEELYESLRGIHFLLKRQMGPDRAEDAYHNLIINLVVDIKRGAIRKAECLPAYAMTIARRKVVQHIGEVVQERQNVEVDSAFWLTSAASESPEQLVLRSERKDIAHRVLLCLTPRNREILIRFYLDGESEEVIRAAMDLTQTQFRLLKSRAKQRYAELVQGRMRPVHRKQSQEALMPAFAV
jgi:RNA polymerase sigma-70 factor (ECF subfamily)